MLLLSVNLETRGCSSSCCKNQHPLNSSHPNLPAQNEQRSPANFESSQKTNYAVVIRLLSIWYLGQPTGETGPPQRAPATSWPLASSKLRHSTGRLKTEIGRLPRPQERKNKQQRTQKYCFSIFCDRYYIIYHHQKMF